MNRVQKLQKLLPQLNVDALYISSPKDLYYLLGVDLSKGALLVLKERAHLIVDGRYFEACKKQCSIDVLLEAKSIYQTLLQGIRSIGFDDETTSFALYQKLTSLFAGSTLQPIHSPVLALRIIKDDEEIEKIKASATLCSDGFDYIVTLLKESITEKELAIELELFWKKRGASGPAFAPIIAFGANSAMPHHRASSKPLTKNQIVLIDIGVVLDGYNSDMTRMVNFGAIDPRLEEIELVVQLAQAVAIKACKAGVLSSELDQVARDFIKQEGFGDYFTHGLGHGVGLDIHELPFVKKDAAIKDILLQSGMVVTIEPGIYLPDVGGVRIEDMVLVQENSCLSFTRQAHEPIKIG